MKKQNIDRRKLHLLPADLPRMFAFVYNDRRAGWVTDSLVENIFAAVKPWVYQRLNVHIIK